MCAITRILAKVSIVVSAVGFSLSAFAEGEQPFDFRRPEFDLKIKAGMDPKGIRIQGDIRKGSSIGTLMGLNTLNYDSRFPDSWSWVDPANPLLMTIKFPGGSHQQVNLGLKEVTKLKLHYENSTYAMAAGAWLSVYGIREFAGELKPTEIQIKVTDRYGGYLDTDFLASLMTEEELKMANQPGGRIEVMVNDPHPRNLPPGVRDIAPPIQQVNLRAELRPEVTFITPFPNLEWSNEDGHLVKVGSAINMKMVGPAGRSSVFLGSMDGVHILNLRPRNDSLSGFDDSSLYIYLPKGDALSAAIKNVVAQKLDGLSTPKLALKISGKVERTNIADFGRSRSLVIAGQTDPFITVDFSQIYSIPFFRFQGDVKVEAVPYDPELFKFDGCDTQVRKP